MSHPMPGPRSIEDIVKEAQDYDHSTVYPLRIALRTAQSMLIQAVIYERDANVEQAYLFLYRHADFYFSLIATHPDAKKPDFKPQVARVRAQVNANIQKLEQLKPLIQKRLDDYRQRQRPRDDAARAASTAAGETTAPALETQSYAFSSQVLSAGQHNDLALQLANRDFRRKRAAAPQEHDTSVDDLSQGIRDIGRQLDGAKHQAHHDASGTAIHSSPYHYPAVPHHARESSAGTPNTTSSLPPLPPTKEALTPTSPLPPPVPSKLSSANTAPTLPAKPDREAPQQQAPPDLASANYTFQPSAFTESGQPLRTLFLPLSLRQTFLSLASANTCRNLETCGILAGTLISNAFFINRLIIPSQVSTSDTCEVTEQGDVALFDYVDAGDGHGAGLTVCGWIHTHPSQTCFLSSRDLHTSVGYQVMLPESIAIVCAPSKNPDHGIFRLTDPPGKDAILACHQPGLFHPHAQSNLYTDASRPGHVCELEGLKYEVVDLRDGGVGKR